MRPLDSGEGRAARAPRPARSGTPPPPSVVELLLGRGWALDKVNEPGRKPGFRLGVTVHPPAGSGASQIIEASARLHDSAGYLTDPFGNPGIPHPRPPRPSPLLPPLTLAVAVTRPQPTSTSITNPRAEP